MGNLHKTERYNIIQNNPDTGKSRRKVGEKSEKSRRKVGEKSEKSRRKVGEKSEKSRRKVGEKSEKSRRKVGEKSEKSQLATLRTVNNAWSQTNILCETWICR